MASERWQRVEEIFHAARQVEKGHRSEFVRQSCAGDEGMLREVESLLAHHEEDGSFIETPAFEATPSADGKPVAAGEVIGHYRIAGNIGSGGMGVIYEAEDLKLGRRVALKFLPEELAQDRQALRRFHREARSASALNHPNICTVYEIGEEAGRVFLAMELVKGKTLRHLLREGPLAARKTIEIATQVAEGLAHAHEAGIAHRDLKPDNLMVSDDGFVKILDFGLAKVAPQVAGGTEADTTWQTSAGMIFGTVGYMSPEQAAGQELDFRSDQFSLGVVLYEMVTGKKAFARRTAAETMVAILREEAEPIGVHQSDAPAQLGWVIERCLAKEPEKRYGSTRELARELAAIRDRVSEMRRPAGAPGRAGNLPAQRTGLVGRQAEVAAVKELLLREDVRLLTVTGPGGIGKTRLAVQVASELLERLGGNAYFVSLSSLNDPGLLGSAIVQTLGIGEAGGRSPLEIVMQHLQDPARPPVLLVLDNFEHLAAAAGTVAELMVSGENLKIIVTSRSALHVYGEHEFPLPPLALPDAGAKSSPESLAQYPAVALFLQRAVAVKPDFKLGSDNASAVAEICARLDGLPLAIELAAARIKILPPSSLLARLSSRLQLLTGGARDLPQRQQTLRAAMDWSYDLLSGPEQRLFRRLSVFAGGCNLEGVEAVCDTKGDLDLDLLDGMGSLVDKSLVRQVEQGRSESRFVMLETVREYAAEKLRESGEEAGTKRAHAAYCLVLAEEVAEPSGAEEAHWVERLSLEHENFRAALDWLIETEDADWGLRLGAALFRFWETREYLTEGRDGLRKLLQLKNALPATKARQRALFAAGVLGVGQGDHAASGLLLRESLEIARQLGDKQGAAVSLNALAVSARERGDSGEACSLFEESMALWQELGDRRAVARSLSNLASTVKIQGDYARARALYRQCLGIFEELGDRSGVAWSLNHEGDAAREQGDSAAARELYEQGLAIFRGLNDRWGIAGTLADLGNLAREQGDPATAQSMYRESLKTFRELDHKRGIARLLEGFAALAAGSGEAERALRMAGAAAALRQQIGAPLTAAEQAKMEASLRSAREALSSEKRAAAWSEGWNVSTERALEEALQVEAESSR